MSQQHGTARRKQQATAGVAWQDLVHWRLLLLLLALHVCVFQDIRRPHPQRHWRSGPKQQENLKRSANGCGVQHHSNSNDCAGSNGNNRRKQRCDRAQCGTTNDNYDQMRCISRATLQSNRHILRARTQMTLRTRASCESLSVDVHMCLPAPSPALGCSPCLQLIKNTISYSSECVCCEQRRAQPVHPQTCHFQLGLVFVINAPSMVSSRELTLDHWSFQDR